MQNHVPSLKDAPRRVPKERIIRYAVEYIHELSNLLNKHDVTRNVHVGIQQEHLSRGYPVLSQSSNFCLSGSATDPEANITLPEVNDNFTFHHVQANSDVANPSFLLELYLGKGQNGETDNITTTGFSDSHASAVSLDYKGFIPISPASSTVTDNNENTSVNESGKQCGQDVMVSPVCRTSPSSRMTPRTLAELFDNPKSSEASSTQGSSTFSYTPNSPSHSESSSSSVLSDEEIDKIFENNEHNDFYEVIMNNDCDFSAPPPSPSSSISGVSQFSSDEEELDFVLDTACDMLPNEYFL